MLVADGGCGADFHGASEDMGCNVGTIRLVAQIFGELFFVSVWSFEARFDRYPRNGEFLPLPISDAKCGFCASSFLCPSGLTRSCEAQFENVQYRGGKIAVDGNLIGSIGTKRTGGPHKDD